MSLGMNISDHKEQQGSIDSSVIVQTPQNNEKNKFIPETSDNRKTSRVGQILILMIIKRLVFMQGTLYAKLLHAFGLWFTHLLVRQMGEIIDLLVMNSYLFFWKCIVLCEVYYVFGSYAWQVIYAFQHGWRSRDAYNDPLYVTIFTVDIFINFHVSYTIRGKTISDVTLTAENYAKNQFIYDVIALSAGIIYGFSIHLLNDMVCLMFFFLMKLPSTKIMDNFLEDILQVHRIRHASYKIFKICFILFVITNLVTMLFYLAGAAAELEQKHSWLDFPNSGFGVIDQLNTDTQLLLAFYWSFGTLMMMNNGDITPKNDYEIMVYFIAVLLGINVFALSLALVQDMVRILSEDQNELSNKLRLMIIYMRQRKIPSPLQDEITSYLGEMIYQKQQNIVEVQQNLIESLPKAMELELTYQTFKVVFEEVEIMDIFSDTFKQQLSTEFEQQLFSEGDFIYLDNQYEYNVPFLYYIVSGEIGVFFNCTSENQSFYLLQAGRYFGLTSFITDQSRNESMCALNFCKLYAISRTNFLQVIEEFPEDKEKFLNAMHDAVFNDGLQKFCYSCGQNNHDLVRCPDIKYVPNPKKLGILWKQAMINIKPELQHRQKNFKRQGLKAKIFKQQLKQPNLTQQNSAEQAECQSVGDHLYLDMVLRVQSPEQVMLNKINQMLQKAKGVESSKNYMDYKNYKDKMNLSDDKKQQIDIDRVCNFEYFLPHNNIQFLVENDKQEVKQIQSTRTRQVTLPRNRNLSKQE